MSKDKFEKLLNSFKQKQSDVENLIFIISNKDLTICKALVAWKNTKYCLNFDNINDDIKDEWEYIWQFCFYDKKQFAMLCDLSISDSEKLFERIKHLRLIYPDGTINDTANGIIKSILKQAINKLAGVKNK